MMPMEKMHAVWYLKPLEWFLKGLAHLPLSVLYVIADLLGWVLCHIVRYRRNVIVKNLADSFPEMAPAQRKAIMHRFYRNFADYFVETIKLAHITDEEMRRRFTFENVEIIDSLFDQGRSIVTYFSHTGNWEWAPSISLWSKHKPSHDTVYAQVYRPLKNKFFDEYFLHLRSRFGSVSVPKATVLRQLLRYKRDGKKSITGFMSDQKPSHGDLIHVVEFLNHPTAIITGTEQLAQKMKMAVIYWDMQKTSRGHYKVSTRLICDDASTMPPMAITDTYAEMLEQTIRRDPAIWLWSHKRWKHPVTFADDNTQHGSTPHTAQ